MWPFSSDAQLFRHLQVLCWVSRFCRQHLQEPCQRARCCPQYSQVPCWVTRWAPEKRCVIEGLVVEWKLAVCWRVARMKKHVPRGGSAILLAAAAAGLRP
eukprot:1161921-Pelagomonas_calceolata.AAC.24